MIQLAITLLKYGAYGFLLTYALWVFYLAVMNLDRVNRQNRLKGFVRYISLVTLAIGYVLDLAVNVIVMTIIFLEIPKETTVTARLKRHNEGTNRWRKYLASKFEPLLDPFDPDGDHI